MVGTFKNIVILALASLCFFACGDEDSSDETTAVNEDGWNQICAETSDCTGVTNLCSKAPGEAEGYCSTTCATTADCPYGEDWSCNIIGTCDAPAATWCGPREETVTNAGIVIACD